MKITTMTAAGVAAALLLPFSGAAPAAASGTATQHGHTIQVEGHGLYVGSVTARSAPSHRPWSYARLVLEQRGGRVTPVRTWTPADHNGFSPETDVTTWHLGRSYPDGSRLCVEWRHRSGRACMIIHR
ncbi:hypothetical protein ACJ6WD_39875 [Streptomyces sp. VTCC 41912]|uniref:hypothetical protein n=1 Tax=Streptomyces sp. VTCC 41912 TaxID=3383243 RepID=UPI003896B272